jgi:hypothetical protein
MPATSKQQTANSKYQIPQQPQLVPPWALLLLLLLLLLFVGIDQI